MYSKINAFNKAQDDNFGITMDAIKSSILNVQTYLTTTTNNLANNIPVNNQQMTQALSELTTLLNQYESLLNDNEIYLYITPDVSKQFTNSINYFNVSINSFSLSDEEQARIMNYLQTQGVMSITTQVKIIQPTILRYTMFVYLTRFNNVLEDDINQQIMNKLSTYFVALDRYDKILKSDIIQLIKGISGVNSVDIYFVSKANEDYHTQTNQVKNIFDVTLTKQVMKTATGSKQVNLQPTAGLIQPVKPTGLYTTQTTEIYHLIQVIYK